MQKKELIERTVENLKAKDMRKCVRAQKTVLHVSDDSGNTKDFEIRKEATGLLFTKLDVSAIAEALMEEIANAMKRGEEVNVYGFGRMALTYRAPRTTKHPDTGLPVSIDGHYTAKFTPGNALRLAARVYETSIDEKEG